RVAAAEAAADSVSNMAAILVVARSPNKVCQAMSVSPDVTCCRRAAIAVPAAPESAVRLRRCDAGRSGSGKGAAFRGRPGQRVRLGWRRRLRGRGGSRRPRSSAAGPGLDGGPDILWSGGDGVGLPGVQGGFLATIAVGGDDGRHAGRFARDDVALIVAHV